MDLAKYEPLAVAAAKAAWASLSPVQRAALEAWAMKLADVAIEAAGGKAHLVVLYLEHLAAGGAPIPEIPDWSIPNDVPNQEGPPYQEGLP